MKWSTLALGPIQTNAYFIVDNQQCLIVDPGAEANKVIQLIQTKKWQPLAILVTHAHFDHIGAVQALKEHYNIPVYGHEAERKWYRDPSLNGSGRFPGFEPITMDEPTHYVTHQETLTIGPFTMNVLHTPGHSPGSVSYFFAEERIVFSGDVLFQQSIGRTDLAGGDSQLLLKTIHNVMLTLPEDTIVCSGHGDITTIQDEMDRNPFLNGF